MLALGASAAFASFPSSPTLDNFAADTSLNPAWSTPALGESPMQLDTTSHELTGSVSPVTAWSGALWRNPPTYAAFSNPVEVWATIHRAGTNDAVLYADVAGGASGTTHPTGGYFVDFGGRTSIGSPSSVSIWRIVGPNRAINLTYVGSPYTSLGAEDQIGMSIRRGVIIAWYKPSGGSWSAT